MAASTVILDDGSTSITINGPQSSEYELLARTVSEQSANYGFRSYQLTSKKLRRWTLQFTSLTLAHKNLLVNFFHDDIIGPTNTFTYTHTDGTVYMAVRIIDDGLRIRRTEPGQFSVSLTIEFDDQLIQ